jgi:uncharacterized protein (DUF924 family)
VGVEGAPLLFDLERDPHEDTNVAEAHRDVIERLGRALDSENP